jgi:hypothetical protein
LHPIEKSIILKEESIAYPLEALSNVWMINLSLEETEVEGFLILLILMPIYSPPLNEKLEKALLMIIKLLYFLSSEHLRELDTALIEEHDILVVVNWRFPYIYKGT